MPVVRSFACLVALAACTTSASEPADKVRVDATVAPLSARVGDEVTVTLVATNPTNDVAHWSSGCGLDLGFELRNANGQVVEAPRFGTCTMELRQLALEPGETLTRSVRWRVGSVGGPAGPLPNGAVQVVGLLGIVDRVARRGTSATLQVLP
jgi:hypothetical protein